MAAVKSSTYATNVSDDLETLDRVRVLADETGAGTIVCGAYWLSDRDPAC